MPGYSKTYSIPRREVEAIKDLGMSYQEARSAQDGHLASWVERKRFERDGRQWVTLQERGQGWAVELAIDADGTLAEVVPLSPEAARKLDE